MAAEHDSIHPGVNASERWLLTKLPSYSQLEKKTGEQLKDLCRSLNSKGGKKVPLKSKSAMIEGLQEARVAAQDRNALLQAEPAPTVIEVSGLSADERAELVKLEGLHEQCAAAGFELPEQAKQRYADLLAKASAATHEGKSEKAKLEAPSKLPDSPDE